MASTRRAIRRNIIRHNAQAMGVPMRYLWRAHQKAKNGYIQRQLHPQTWWSHYGMQTCVGVVMVAIIVYLLLTVGLKPGV